MSLLMPDTTHAKRQRGFTLLFICLISVGMGQSLFLVLLPPEARDMGLTEVQVSAIFTLSAVLWIVMSPIWGRLSDVWGRKPIILIGLLGFCISTGGFGILLMLGQRGIFPLMAIYAMMIFTRGLFGMFGSGTPTAAQAYVADRTTREERTSGVAAIGAAFGMGTILGPGFAAALVGFHLLAPFFVLSVFAFGCVVALLFYLPERRRRHNRGNDKIKMKITDKRIRPFLFMGVAVSTIQAAVMQVATFFVIDTLYMDKLDAVQIVGIGMMGMAMATLFAQLVIIPRANASVRSLLTYGILVNAVGIALLLLPMTQGLFVFGLTLQGLGMGLMRPAVAAGGSLAVTPKEQGAVAGFNSSTAAVGIIFVPIFVMPLYLIIPTAPFWLALVLTLMMLVLARSPALDNLETPIDTKEVEEKTLSRAPDIKM